MLLTVGHSNHSIEAFLGLLTLYRVARLADVRSVPFSRRHPHFSRDALDAALGARGIAYRHFPGLGGKREIRYAEHMASLPFRQALDQLLEYSAGTALAAMCAEADPLQCHRQYLADAVLARGTDVIHLLANGGFRYHELSPLARVSNDVVTYPTLLDRGE